jgi:WD40 repeat protein
MTGDIIRSLNGHTGPVNELAFEPSGWRLASGSQSNELRVWDIATGASLWKHSVGVLALAWCMDGRLASGGVSV